MSKGTEQIKAGKFVDIYICFNVMPITEKDCIFSDKFRFDVVFFMAHQIITTDLLFVTILFVNCHS